MNVFLPIHLIPSADSQDSAQLNLQAAPLSPSKSSSQIITRSQTGNLKPRRFPGFHLYSTRHPLQALHASLVSPEPRTYSQAVSIPEWYVTMDNEFQSLLKNETWSLCSLPPNKNVVPCKWIFKLKRRPDGSIERHKARLIAVGYLQRNRIDFLETFSLVIKPSTVRMVLTLCHFFSMGHSAA